MGLHKGRDRYFEVNKVRGPVPSAGWRFGWPNTADFNFNYYKLLKAAAEKGIAQNRNPNIRIAVVGAGEAGLAAARELFRCGYTHIDIYEASDRIGGRTYSIPIQSKTESGDTRYTVFEMGAMRMPFFSAPGSENCVLDYYRALFGITTQPFPDPGSQFVDTGIYMNGGYGPDRKHPHRQPRMDIWRKGEPWPPTEVLKRIDKKWTSFATMVKSTVSSIYNQGERAWEKFWLQMVNHYWTRNFRELVYMPAIANYNPRKPGFFGGLGMKEEEAALFYTIGAGDGSWGAFYDISCLYPIRTLLFGYGTNHQLIQGKFNSMGTFSPGPHYGETITDSHGNQLTPPNYLGVETFAESLFYQPVTSAFVEEVSLYQATKMKEYGINLYTRCPVEKIHLKDSGTIRLATRDKEADYNAVILTPGTWALQMSVDFHNFTDRLWPLHVLHSFRESHYITSCKVFYPLKGRYWEKSKIPQIIATDTFLQGAYGYAVETQAIKDDPGALLISYTWEDDAAKLIAELELTDEVLAKKCLDQLDHILEKSTNIKTPISPYVDTSRPCVIHWAKQPTYRGCAKLYRERSWIDDMALLAYNQEYSAKSNLYFAGEAYSVEGGWTEPALRLGLDAVLHVVKNTGGKFLNGFDFKRDYPRYDTKWNPGSSSG